MNSWRILNGDVREMLKGLPDASVQTCVTSPPYFGLRDYGMSQQIGLDTTPEKYVAAIVDVFRDVRRVLKKDGTLWLNLGDSYNSGGGTVGGGKHTLARKQNHRDTIESCKPKDMLGIPWMVAFALRADGWYLRSDIIWSKPNPMPESVTDRPTKSHEYIFLLSKSRSYYYNAAAIREPYAHSTLREFDEGYEGHARKDYAGTGAQNASDVKARIVKGRKPRPGIDTNGGNQGAGTIPNMSECGGANKRSVWNVATHPYPDAHFATYPEKLIEPCVLAGSQEGDTVLDPFTGSGTTGAVSIRLQRNFIGCELNPEYVQLARTRIGEVAPLLAAEVA